MPRRFFPTLRQRVFGRFRGSLEATRQKTNLGGGSGCVAVLRIEKSLAVEHTDVELGSHL
jgi:hypothetical protein